MQLTPAEWRLMSVLWEESPLTVSEISERLPPGKKWAYTTMKTMLTRLEAKGAVSEHKRSHLGFFEPLLTKRKARAAALRAVLDNAFEGAFGPLMHFLVEEEALSPAERRELKRMLEEKAKKGGKR